MTLSDRIALLQNQLQASRHRLAVVLIGDYEWRIQQLNECANLSGLWLGENAPSKNWTAVPFQQLPHHLGQEVPHAVACHEQGFDADSIALASGLIQAGGIFWFLIPTLEEWLTQPNAADRRFLSYPGQPSNTPSRFNRLLWQELCQQAWIVQQNTVPPPFPPLPSGSPMVFDTTTELFTDQQNALKRIQPNLTQRKSAPILIQADRGRGKTTLLGALAAFALQKQLSVTITTARYAQTAGAFAQAAKQLACSYAPGLLTYQSHAMRFRAPDELMLSDDAIELLLIDEAAHLPLPILQGLLKRANKVVMATTQYGYEGSGRGFSVKMLPFLNEHYPDWQHIELTEPIRWAQNDPLEQTIHRALWLEPPNPELNHVHPINAETVEIDCVIPNSLPFNELKPIFYLLVEAHYQTRPSDLQQLLDAPDWCLYRARNSQGQLLGVLLINPEGHLPDLGAQRRLKGHLVPQLLRYHSGQNEWLSRVGERAVRLAVAASVRRQKIGQKLVQAWQTQSKADYLSASFGVTQDLHRFWRSCDFQTLHLGAKRDKASGTNNAVMIKPLKDFSAFHSMKKHIQQQLAHFITEFIYPFDPTLIIDLLTEVSAPLAPAEQTELEQQLLLYAQGKRPYEACCFQFWQLNLTQPQRLTKLSRTEQQFWLEKTLYKKNWNPLALEYKLAGQRATETHFKTLLQKILR
jgi:tRNA(Met) cytidine acetyltransferase